MTARVTVVNDTPDFLALVRDILEGDRFDTVLIDGDRDDAFELIRQSHADVLMIDLRLGQEGLSGWDIAQQVRASPEFSGLPVLICSADALAMRELESDLAGTRHVATLAKPFGIDELTEAIQHLLDPGPRAGRTEP
jgi:CheY-like chemotaxis protein